jgi:hypothetical protein
MTVKDRFVPMIPEFEPSSELYMSFDGTKKSS